MNDVCYRCQGNGTYLGNGMMITDCELCGDNAQESKILPPSLDKIDRRSKSYKKTIDDLMELNPKLSRDDAVKLFDETYEKI
jgi:hypothetical protein